MDWDQRSPLTFYMKANEKISQKVKLLLQRLLNEKKKKKGLITVSKHGEFSYFELKVLKYFKQ